MEVFRHPVVYQEVFFDFSGFIHKWYPNCRISLANLYNLLQAFRGRKYLLTMKKIPVLLALLFCAVTGRSQQVDLKDLVEFTDLDVQKFDAHIGRKAFKRDYNSPRETQSNYNYFQVKKVKKGEPITRKISYQQASEPVVCYQTTSEKEFSQLKHKMLDAGFRCYENQEDAEKPLLYQKGPYAINTSTEIIDSAVYYTLVLNRLAVPKLKDINYVEDLLQVSSHEVLVDLFGHSNVQQDIFRFSETETNTCSVLFPNTPREVIFIWDDEANYRRISFLLIGKHAETRGTSGFSRQVEQNEWVSRQGVYQNMTLRELQELNGGKVQFYGWASEQPGVLTPANTGKIDFKKLGIVLSCLDCSGNKIYQTSLVDSQRAIADDKRIYVSAMIILPEKEKSSTAKR